MLRGVINDVAFHNLSQTEIGDLGYLPVNIDQFLSDHQTITDNRLSRLPITYRHQEMSYNSFISYIMGDIYKEILSRHYLDLNNDNDIALIEILLDNIISKVNGQMTEGTVFTIDRSMSLEVHYDKSTLDMSDEIMLSAMSQSEYNGMFNIIEKLALGILYQNTAAEIETELLADTTTFKGYKPGSAVLSNKRLLGHIYDGVNIDVICPPYIQFTIMKMGGYELPVKLWLSRRFFEQEYPFTSIVQVVPPADLTTLLNLNSISNQYAGLFESRETVDQELAPHITYGLSYSGLKAFTVPYKSQIDGSTHDTMFSVLYRGAEPSVLVIKNAIKDYLINSGIGEVDDWIARYPTLFINNMYYIFPIWDESYSTANRTVFRSILTEQKKSVVLSNIQNVNTHVNTSDMCILNAAYNASFSISLPDNENLNSTSLVSYIPDYTRITPSNEIYNLLSTEAKEFITLFNKALAKAAGENNTLERVNINNYEYIRFVVGDREFYVMTKDSYNVMNF